MPRTDQRAGWLHRAITNQFSSKSSHVCPLLPSSALTKRYRLGRADNLGQGDVTPRLSSANGTELCVGDACYRHVDSGAQLAAPRARGAHVCEQDRAAPRHTSAAATAAPVWSAPGRAPARCPPAHRRCPSLSGDGRGWRAHASTCQGSGFTRQGPTLFNDKSISLGQSPCACLAMRPKTSHPE